jgi:hypothetical protein
MDALHKKFHQLNVAASPPDVRQGYALPDDLSFSMAGYALGSGLPHIRRQSRGGNVKMTFCGKPLENANGEWWIQ